MKKDITDSNLVSKMLLAANLYYKDKMSQQEIAKKMNISRPWVSKLLTRAEVEGIVKITISSPYSCSDELETKLKEKYALKHVEIIHESGNANAIATAAAKYFVSILKFNDTIGIGWGTGVSRLISHISAQLPYPDVHIYPLAGSFGEEANFVPNLSAIRLSEVLRANAHMLHLPARCSNVEELNVLLQNEQAVDTLNRAEHSDILLLGIGVVEDSFSASYGLFTDEDVKEMHSHGAIGDVALQYFDKNGETVKCKATELMIKADVFKACANAKTSIGIAYGLNKTNIIDVALNKRLVNVLFTDEETALSLLNL